MELGAGGMDVLVHAHDDCISCTIQKGAGGYQAHSVYSPTRHIPDGCSPLLNSETADCLSRLAPEAKVNMGTPEIPSNMWPRAPPAGFGPTVITCASQAKEAT